MEFLPTDLHCLLAQFVDKSTRLLLPLTCRALLNSLGKPHFSLAEAVQAATRDDNLALLLLFLRDKTSRRKKTFYSSCVFNPLLESDSFHVAEWFCKKGYAVYKRALWFQRTMKVSVRVLDLFLARVGEEYDDELLLKVLEFDRVDILCERYSSRHVLSSRQWGTILHKDALKCFRYCISRTNQWERASLQKRLLAEGGTNIVNDFLEKSQSPFSAKLVSLLIENPNYHSTFVFDFYKEEYRLSREQSLRVVRTKSYPVVSTLLADTLIDEEYCQAALDSASHEIVGYIFGRFEGIFSSPSPIGINRVTPLTLELVASKLENIKCLTEPIIYHDSLELFPRLVTETGLKHIPLRQIIPFHRISQRVFHAYLTTRTVEAEEQIELYSFYRKQLLDIFAREGVQVCLQILALEAKKERASKRRRLA